MWIVLFLPAWSLNYWQAWIYWIIFFVSVSAISVYFIKKDISLIAKRVKAGPTAETQLSQKVIQAIAAFCFILLLLIPPLDFRFQWSNVPSFIVVISDIFVVIGLATVFFVFRENTFSLSYHRSKRKPNGNIHWAIQICSSSDVFRSFTYVVFYPPCFRFILGVDCFFPYVIGYLL